MTTQTAQVAIQPLVGWPHEARQGETYLMTVDVRLAAGAIWPYEHEEFPIYCMLTGGQAYSIRPLGMPAVVLHRFGGSYGPARFLLKALESTDDSGLRLSLLNKWGMPILGVPLPMRIVSASERNGHGTAVQLDRPLRTPSQVPEIAFAREEPEDVAPSPDAAHCELVLQHMVRGDLVPLLGSRLTEDRAESHEGRRLLPNAEDLAVELAGRMRMTFPRPDLPRVAQYVRMLSGEPRLHQWLSQLLKADYEPGPVHRFLARFPRTLEELGLDRRYQLIVSTSFDTTLEQAFDHEQEPYDLAVYMASGQDRGKFVHFPFGGSPVPIAHPNGYSGFPIGYDGELERTVIVKVHGAVDGNIGDYRWTGNYVITEDDYIDYLSGSPVESFVPMQILAKLRESNCLFFGYTMRDWTQRVFLRRTWQGGRFEAASWAVKRDADMLEQRSWQRSGVSLHRYRLTDYVESLDRFLREHHDELA